MCTPLASTYVCMNYSTYAMAILHVHTTEATTHRDFICEPELIQQIRHAVWCSSRHILDGIGAGCAVVIATLTTDVAVLQRQHGDCRSGEEVFRMRHPVLFSALSSGGSRNRREHICEKLKDTCYVNLLRRAAYINLLHCDALRDHEIVTAVHRPKLATYLNEAETIW